MWIIVPTSVFIASIAESGILCADAINSTENLPSLIILPNSTTFSSAFASKLCSLSLEFIRPIVNAVEYIGTFTFLSKYGIEPIWSSWPCVITSPFILSIFFSIYVKSGITISTPSISSSGNASPQSTIIASLLYSNTVIFFPISSSPPSGIILIVPLEFVFLFLFVFKLTFFLEPFFLILTLFVFEFPFILLFFFITELFLTVIFFFLIFFSFSLTILFVPTLVILVSSCSFILLLPI